MQKLELLNLNCSQYFCSILFQYCGISLSSYLPDPFGECWRHWDLFQALKDAVLGLVPETTLRDKSNRSSYKKMHAFCFRYGFLLLRNQACCPNANVLVFITETTFSSFYLLSDIKSLLKANFALYGRIFKIRNYN